MREQMQGKPGRFAYGFMFFRSSRIGAKRMRMHKASPTPQVDSFFILCGGEFVLGACTDHMDVGREY